MSQKDKLIKRLKCKPRDFTFVRVSSEATAGSFRTGGNAMMNNTIKYKDYVGSVEFSETDGVFYGKVMGIRALISYEGTTAQELIDDFHSAVDEYLELCEVQNIEPEKAYKGTFNVRISPELHKQAVVYAFSRQMSLNSLVEEAVQYYVTSKE